ncbi:hypothetical protein D8674_034435 [Pyrus ussuriensis x Pyrus communis]|uniref:Uncharacterized protein n=1 Tax=Pyrus ussuriensis x Pyrus communis TaxID=2448454 RepID=A0A5N5HVZ0_9ROSA|nr:hypothetical protein D8674_034435 [Pyrus ussuriensis x Pyrus communis]
MFGLHSIIGSEEKEFVESIDFFYIFYFLFLYAKRTTGGKSRLFIIFGPRKVMGNFTLLPHASMMNGGGDLAEEHPMPKLEFGEKELKGYLCNLLHLAHANDRFSLLSLSSPCRTDCGFLSLEKVKRIKVNTLARLIAIVEPIVNEEILVKKKLKISSVARESPPSVEKPLIDINSSNGKKNEAARSELVAPAMSRMANSIVDTKFSSHSEMLAIMKSDKVDFAAKVALRPTHSAAKTDSPAGKEETARVGSCKKSTKLASGEAVEICVLLKPDLLEDMDACAKFVDGVRNLETAHQEIVVLKTRLDAIQVKYEYVEKEIGCYIPQIQDLDFTVYELHFIAYAKDEELIIAYNQVIHFKRIVDRLEPQVLELQDVLKINKSSKKEMDDLQRVRVGLLKENEQLKGEKDGFEASIGEVVEEVGAQARATEGEALDDAAAKNVATVEDVVTE